MQRLKTIYTTQQGAVTKITLNRPDVRNAMNLEMVRELSGAISKAGRKEKTRVIVLDAEGPHFSAGADLNWMRSGLQQSEKKIRSESSELAGLFRLISTSETPVIASVRGKVMGGANGLVAAADLAVAERSARFAFSEVKLGLVPATIAPYVLRKTGPARAAEFMLTGRMFGASEAREAGLVQRLCPEGDLDGAVADLTGELLSGGPAAIRGIKSMLQKLGEEMITDAVMEYTAELIAAYRVSPEGQKGMAAFLEKRKPPWNETG